MVNQVNTKLVNELAAEYASNKNNFIFHDLFKEMYVNIRFMAKQASRRAMSTGLSIPFEDFESYFCEALYQASIGYENQKGDFMPRFHSFLKLREADVWRSYRTKQAKEIDRKGIRYYKAQWDSLDRNLGEGAEGLTLRDLVLPSSSSAEELYFRNIELAHIYEILRNINAQHAKVVSLLEYGATRKELAYAFGEEVYNARVRKLVQRARSSLKRSLVYNSTN